MFVLGVAGRAIVHLLPCPVQTAGWGRGRSPRGPTWSWYTRSQGVFHPIQFTELRSACAGWERPPLLRGITVVCTLGPSSGVTAAARASQPSMRAISCTSAFTSLGLVFLDRSWPSFANRHGWVDTRTLGGKAMMERGVRGRREGLKFWEGILSRSGLCRCVED